MIKILDYGIKANDKINIQKEKRQLNGLSLFSFIICIFALFPMVTFTNCYKILIIHSIFILCYSIFFIFNITGNFKITRSFFNIIFILHITIITLFTGMANGLPLFLFILTPMIAYLTNRKIIIFSIISIIIFFLINLIWIFLPELRIWLIVNGTGSLKEIIETNKETYYGFITIFICLILLFTLFINTLSISIKKYEIELERLNKLKLEKITNKLLKKLDKKIKTGNYDEILKILNNRFKISERQIEIISLIIEGFMNKEIAYKLHISENTVNTHIKRIFEKLNINTKFDLIKIMQNI